MGATDFYNTAHGTSAQAAFNAAVESAQYEHGHGGYTGTIAEKSEFTLIDRMDPKVVAAVKAHVEERISRYAANDDDTKVRYFQKILTEMAAGIPPNAELAADALMNADDDRIADKWGPAGCLEVTKPADGQLGEYYFFGYASC